MYIPNAGESPQKNSFDVVVRPFLERAGLPFAEVLTTPLIERVFARHGGLFAEDDIYSTPLVLWAFLAQVLHGGKSGACAAAVADIATYLQQVGKRVPSGDTGDYCRARAKLSLPALRELTQEVARGLEDKAAPAWLWHGRHAKLVDGFTFTMPDTFDNQAEFPQQKTQQPGVGLPIARACAILSLATAAILDVNIGPGEGKATGETALLRGLLDNFQAGDIAVFDRYYCSFMLLATLQLRGVDYCSRVHHLRNSDFRRGQRLGPDDHLVTWTRPTCPPWMPPEAYARIPATITLRELRYHVTEPNRRTTDLVVVTSLVDPGRYSKEKIAELYGRRWNVELDIRHLKQTLGLDHVRCKTPPMVRRELWVTLLGYNLIRRLIAAAAARHERQPRQMGFTFACQTVLSSWMTAAAGAIRDERAHWTSALARIAAHEVANRPGRIEPRVLKRRRHRYSLMQKPRHELRKALPDP